MGMINFDLYFSFAELIIGLTLLIVIWKALGCLKDDHDYLAEKTSPRSSILIIFLSIALILLIPSLIISLLTSDYPLIKAFGDIKSEFSFFEIYNFFLSQLVIIYFSCLCSICWGSKVIDTAIQWSLLSLCIGLVFKAIQQYFPVFHWIQFVEFIISVVIALLIPLLGVFVIKYLHKLSIRTDVQKSV